MVGCLVGWSVGWLVGWTVGWMVGWFVGWRRACRVGMLLAPLAAVWFGWRLRLAGCWPLLAVGLVLAAGRLACWLLPLFGWWCAVGGFRPLWLKSPPSIPHPPAGRWWLAGRGGAVVVVVCGGLARGLVVCGWWAAGRSRTPLLRLRAAGLAAAPLQKVPGGEVGNWGVGWIGFGTDLGEGG